VITIPNERLLAVIDRQTSMLDAFVTADDVLRQAIQGISDLILVPGIINLDFADVKAIMSGMGMAMMGTATGDGHTRAVDAANRAVSSPLLEDASVNGARGVIVNVTGGPDMSLMEVNDAMSIIHEAAHEDANIIFGAVMDPTLSGRVKITVIATGFDQSRIRTIAASPSSTPVDLSNYTAHLRAGAGANAIDATHSSIRMPITRRTPLDMPLQRVAAGGGAAEGLEPGEVDLTMELEVPAFLRRQNE
jgi:cell division protein FtsZ